MNKNDKIVKRKEKWSKSKIIFVCVSGTLILSAIIGIIVAVINWGFTWESFISHPVTQLFLVLACLGGVTGICAYVREKNK